MDAANPSFPVTLIQLSPRQIISSGMTRGIGRLEEDAVVIIGRPERLQEFFLANGIAFDGDES